MVNKSYKAEFDSYVEGISNGKIIACKWVKLAVKRHLRDIKSSKNKTWPYEYDEEKGDRACRFMEMLPHVKGEWAKPHPITRQVQKMKLELWQVFIIKSIFGWVKKKTGKRRFQKARIYVPRKNGKSFLAAGIGLFMLVCDGESGAEVYAGATSIEQALKVFQPARLMCVKLPELTEYFGLTVNVQSLVKESDGSKFIPIIGKPGDGDSPHCAIIDEYHEHKTSCQLDTMETGMGARSQPLSLVISTAGANIASPCREDWKQCEEILKNAGGFDDDTTFCIIWTIDEGDAWDTESALVKANPNWGVSINAERILAELKVAQQSAIKQSAFKTKYLNRWVSARDGFFNVSQWEKLGKEGLKPEDFKQYPCFLSGDLASKHDLVALMQLFCLPDKRYALFGKYYLPQATLDLPENQHYRNWQIQGWIEAAGDEVTDLDNFKIDVLELCKEYQVEEMPSDPNRAWGVFPALVKEGVPIVEYRNTVLSMSEPMKQLDAWIRDGSIVHNGDPVLAWAISNVTAKLDKKDNVFPNKENPNNKIDPVVAAIMAVGRAMLKDESPSAPLFSW